MWKSRKAQGMIKFGTTCLQRKGTTTQITDICTLAIRVTIVFDLTDYINYFPVIEDLYGLDEKELGQQGKIVKWIKVCGNIVTRLFKHILTTHPQSITPKFTLPDHVMEPLDLPKRSDRGKGKMAPSTSPPPSPTSIEDI
ncbi:hypothetical protein Tco_1082604 [Tanacetum coccineum]|uniref:Uncharacterized protein n=1 Tax=Tanacetum coccineum TaxID=301880 RepID=A0ABQ5I105_9ASTR